MEMEQRGGCRNGAQSHMKWGGGGKNSQNSPPHWNNSVLLRQHDLEAHSYFQCLHCSSVCHHQTFTEFCPAFCTVMKITSDLRFPLTWITLVKTNSSNLLIQLLNLKLLQIYIYIKKDTSKQQTTASHQPTTFLFPEILASFKAGSLKAGSKSDLKKDLGIIFSCSLYPKEWHPCKSGNTGAATNPPLAAPFGPGLVLLFLVTNSSQNQPHPEYHPEMQN